ncbi:MAG: hypothetical protein WD397_17340 [Wenzhouxiangellaceae bacterium]
MRRIAVIKAGLQRKEDVLSTNKAITTKSAGSVEQQPECQRNAKSVTGNLAIQAKATGVAADNPPRSFSFPHGKAIHHSLGQNLPLSAVLDPTGCAARQTPAFTRGPVTHFAFQQPDLHLAAHEAAHQLQHAGHAHDAGLGAEGHAHAVAEAVTRGGPAAHLMGKAGRRVPSAERHYVNFNGGRLGSQGRTLTMGGQVAYAEAGLINGANSILSAKKSGVEISPGGGSQSVPVPGKRDEFRTLSKVDVKTKMDPNAWGTPDFYDDCGRAAREVMGATGTDTPAVAVFKDIEGVLRETPMPGVMKKDPREIIALTVFMSNKINQEKDYAKLSADDKRKLHQKIRSEYAALSPDDKEKIISSMMGALTPSSAAGLGMDNEAKPEVGEAYSIRDTRYSQSKKGVYHWAAVIMVAGPDRVTFEHTSESEDYNAKVTNWEMQTYGTGSQSFHNEYKAGFGHDNARTVRARTPGADSAELAELQTQAHALSTRQLIRRHQVTTDATEKRVFAAELQGRSARVGVHVMETEDWTGSDDVYVTLSNGSAMVATDTRPIADGDSAVFHVNLGSLAPKMGNFTVNIFDWDADGDDLIGSIAWPAPYSTLITTVNSGGHYQVQLSL